MTMQTRATRTRPVPAAEAHDADARPADGPRPGRRRAAAAALVAITACGSALAHHVADGAVPSSLFEGLLSGLAHPVLGLDHFTFLLAAALLVAWSGLGGGFAAALAIAFGVASTAGAWLRVTSLELAFAEAGIALSLLALAWLLFEQRVPARWALVALALGAGFFHGQAFGESIAGAAPFVLAAYLFGLATMQLALLTGTHLAGRWAQRLTPDRIADSRRLVSVGCSLLGVLCLASALTF